MTDTPSEAAPAVAPAPVVVEAAPVVTEVATPVVEQAVTEALPEAVKKATSRRDRVAAMRERLKTRESNETKPRNPDGTFAAEKTETPAAAPAVAAEEAPSDAAAPVVAESGTSDVPKTVTIPLDRSHPLYDQGVTELKDVPAHLERQIRTMANATVRAKQAEQASAAQQVAETKLATLQAKMELMQSGDLPQFDSDPEVQVLLSDIEKAYPDQSDLMKRALVALQTQEMQEKEASITATVRRDQVGRQFLSSVTENAGKQYPVWQQSGELGQRMQNAVAQYGDYVDARNMNLVSVGRPESEPSSKEFFEWVDSNYVRDSRVQEALKSYQNKSLHKSNQQAAADAAAKERKRMTDAEAEKLSAAAQRHSTRPPTPPPVRSQGNVNAATETNPAQNHGTRQRDLRSSIRQRLASSAR